eukprot:TRINITY_DN3034_c0_g1_i2.p1 TRINITY_DN3034_c0_g1~~TRINITY_DN3034_c0_g1_i2.p1  ORF type:complete len:562 (+),score=116.85 TRINITY_DN3034_c0_g1_i2:86-1771(+)
MKTIDGPRTLERRGWIKWQEVKVQLSGGNKLAVLDSKGDVKEHLEIQHLDKLSSDQKSEEFAFQLYFAGKKEKWTLRALSQEDYDTWMSVLEANLAEINKDGSTYNYGLPDRDPRTDLPLISVPSDFTGNFAYLNMAVIHWFGVVKKLGVGFSVEERIAVLGDRCLYLCKRNADITRCVMISDIERLLLAQDDAKDLYISIIMPETVNDKTDEKKPPRPEYDLMFHSDDIQTFVRYLRTVYVYLTSGKMLALDQVKDKRQLDHEVRLVRPKGWELTYWQPMFKQHLAHLLEQWYKQQGGNADSATSNPTAAKITDGPNKADVAKNAEPATGGNSSGGGGGGGLDDEDPLGKFLVMISLSKYYNLLKAARMTLEMLVNGLIDESDIRHFGVESEADRAKIIRALQDKDLIDRLTAGSISEDQYNPPKPADFAGIQPKLADDDLDLDLDFGGGGGGAVNPAPVSSGGGAMSGLDDFDLDDFSPVAAPTGPTAIDLDDFDDLDIGGGGGGGGGNAIKFDDFDDLDLDLEPKKPVGGATLDDFDDLDLGGPPAKPAAAIDLDDDL